METVNRKIVVVGGGTAGWLSALMARRSVPDCDITVIESEDIGILGAGEGTTPHFVKAMDYLGIPVSRIIKEAGGTIKSAIKFTGWSQEWEKNDHYYHGFNVHDPQRFGESDSLLGNHNLFYMLNSYHGISPKETEFTAIYSNAKKVPFYLQDATPEFDGDPIHRYDNFGNFAMHFNARLLAEMLKGIATKERGIERIEGKVNKVNTDGYGNVVSLQLEDGKKIEADFVFDCSGFARLIVGKHYESEWQAHDYLPAKRAVPFFIPFRPDENIPAYTESIAMKYGWMWKIPVDGRYGCGYVFDSDFISEEEAVKEIEEFLGFEPEYPRKDKGGFKFNAGYFKDTWVNNVIAVGLSSGFIEPLEATSIWVSLVALEEVMDNPYELFNRDEVVINRFNQKMRDMNQEIAEFIYLHYMCGRTDTDFWKRFNDVERAPQFIQELLGRWEHSIPKYRDFLERRHFFQYYNWWHIAYGVGHINHALIKKVVEANKLTDASHHFMKIRDEQKFFSENVVTHNAFLEAMKGSFDAKAE